MFENKTCMELNDVIETKEPAYYGIVTNNM